MSGTSAQVIEEILRDDQKLDEVTKAAFDSVDTDGSGFIEQSELKTAMSSATSDMGVDSPSDGNFNEVFRELDVNGDRKLSLEEFKVLMRQVLEIMASQS